MGIADVSTRSLDLLNLLRARRDWAGSRVEIALLNEYRDMLEGVYLSSRQISETTRLKLDDGFNLTS